MDGSIGPAPAKTRFPPHRLRSLFISDVHLGSRECRADLLLEFLSGVETETLYLVGDIVDLWALRRSVHWPGPHGEVVRLLFRKARSGTRVVYVPGNHDGALREFCGSNFNGVEVRRHALHVTADGRRLLVMHGDEFDAAVKTPAWLAAVGAGAYDFTLALNRYVNAGRGLLGRPYWSLAGFLKSRVGNAMRHIARFEQAAALAARRRGVDGVVCGHIHRPGIRRIDGVLYCNDGDWVENCTALVEDRNGRLAIWDVPGATRRGLVEPVALDAAA